MMARTSYEFFSLLFLRAALLWRRWSTSPAVVPSSLTWTSRQSGLNLGVGDHGDLVDVNDYDHGGEVDSGYQRALWRGMHLAFVRNDGDSDGGYDGIS